MNPTIIRHVDDTFGLAEAHLTFPVGWASESAHGCTRVAAELFARGTTRDTPERIRDRIAALSASIHASAEAERTRIYLSSHEDRLDDVVELALELAEEFAVRGSEYDRALARIRSEHRTVAESPDRLADLALRRSLWPQGRLSWGSSGAPARLGQLRSEDVVERWEQIFGTPALVTSCASSDASLRTPMARLNRHRPTRLNEAFQGVEPPEEPAHESALHVKYARDADVIRIAKVLPALNSTGRATVSLLNFALSGGFLGVLYRTLRTERNLVYAVSTDVVYRPSHTLWILRVSPAAGAAREVLDVLPHAMDELDSRLRGVHYEAIVQRYQLFLQHRYARWASRFSAIRRDLEDGRPMDERARLASRVGSLDPEAVRRSLKSWSFAESPRHVVHLGGEPATVGRWRRASLNELTGVPQRG